MWYFPQLQLALKYETEGVMIIKDVVVGILNPRVYSIKKEDENDY